MNLINRLLITFSLLLALVACSDHTDEDTPAVLASPTISGTLPVLHINTENSQEITSKTIYINATYWLDTQGIDTIAALGSPSEPLSLQIRGRGHSSWKGEKKPYKLKLDKKASIMGMPKNKHWALLKPTENTITGLYLGQLIGFTWTPNFRPVEVVLNDDYIGLYFLTETIRIDENRVNIYEQKDNETDPELIAGGWLVEIDNYQEENQISIIENNRWRLKITYHSPEVLSNSQLEWLTTEFQTINSAIYSSDKTSKTWEKYIDIESMARFFILQEVLDNPDGFHGSFYLHKDLAPEAKWVAGPIWDLTCYSRDKTDYTFRMKAPYGFTPHWIGEIIQYPNFCNAVREIWSQVYPARLSLIYNKIDSTILPLEQAWQNDCARWDEDPTQTVYLRAQRVKTALQQNMLWFDAHIPE